MKETIQLTPAEYRSLLVIKMNAELLALTSNEQYRELVINLIKDCEERKQPVLVGTTSIEKSEFLSLITNLVSKLFISIISSFVS